MFFNLQQLEKDLFSVVKESNHKLDKDSWKAVPRKT